MQIEEQETRTWSRSKTRAQEICLSVFLWQMFLMAFFICDRTSEAEGSIRGGNRAHRSHNHCHQEALNPRAQRL